MVTRRDASRNPTQRFGSVRNEPACDQGCVVMTELKEGLELGASEQRVPQLRGERSQMLGGDQKT